MLEKAPLAEYVPLKYPWDKSDDTPKLTGIPPDALILAEFRGLKKKLDEMKESLASGFEDTLKRELDDREVGGAAYNKMAEMV